MSTTLPILSLGGDSPSVCEYHLKNIYLVNYICLGDIQAVYKFLAYIGSKGCYIARQQHCQCTYLD